MSAVRNVLQQRHPRTVSPLLWFRCCRCNRLTYAEIIANECDVCVKAAVAVWAWAGHVAGEMSGS
jgi:hypothetical protein